MHLRRKCILLVSDGMSYTYQCSLSGLTCHLRLCFLINFMSVHSVHQCKWGIKVPHYYCATVISPFMTVSICLIHCCCCCSASKLCPTLCDPRNAVASATVLEYSVLISFRIDWFDLLAVQEALKNILQHHNLKASILGTQYSLWSNSYIHI